MHQRLDYKHASPDAFKAMLNVEQQVHPSGHKESLLELVKTRAAQTNGCASMPKRSRTASAVRSTSTL